MTGLPITRLQYVALNARDPARAAEFAVERMGFSLAHTAADGTTYLRAHGVDPYSLVYKPVNEPGLHHASYLVDDAAALEAAADWLDRAGVDATWHEDHEWQHPPAIRLSTPAGHVIELTTGVNIDLPISAMVQRTSAAPAPLGPDHVGLGTAAFDQEVAFALDVMGQRSSSLITAPDGATGIMAFVRAPGRYLYHDLVVVRNPLNRVHHLQFTLKDREAFFAAEAALRASGVEVEWGPLRHGPGHNIAMYFRDAEGYWIEYSVEEEIVLDDDHYVPRKWIAGTDIRAIDEWGTGGKPPMSLGGPPPELAMRMGRMLGKVLYVGISRVVDPWQGLPPGDVLLDHVKYIHDLEQQGKIFGSGPFVTDDGAMDGGDALLIVRANSWEEAHEILSEEPVHKAGFRTFELRGWRVNEGRIDLSVNFSDGSYVLG